MFERLQPFQRKVYVDVTGMFAFPADESDIPFDERHRRRSRKPKPNSQRSTASCGRCERHTRKRSRRPSCHGA